MNKVLALTVLVLAGFACSQTTLPQKVPLKPKIVGGEDAKKNEFPYQVSLQEDNTHFCGGSIINENYILTAAHCVYQIGESKVTVMAGEHNISSPTNDGTEQSRSVVEVQLHENYDDDKIQNDIALLKLSSPLKLNDEVAPIPLPKQGHSATGMALVSGWGLTNSTLEDPSTILQKVSVPIITNELCKTAYVGTNDVTEDMICAGYQEGGKNHCDGDSGGPMVVAYDDGTYYLVGVVSWVDEPCGSPGKPGVYADVSHFVTWINQKMASGQVVFLKFCSPQKKFRLRVVSLFN